MRIRTLGCERNNVRRGQAISLGDSAADQDDIDITQEARSRHASKPTPDNDHTLASHGMSEDGWFV
jgi:hypothetical protein